MCLEDKPTTSHRTQDTQERHASLAPAEAAKSAEGLKPGTLIRLRNGAKAIVGHADRAIVFAGVENITQGTVVEFKSSMGHVLCDGNDHDHQDECILHPCDASHKLDQSELSEEDLTFLLKNAFKGIDETVLISAAD